MHATDVTQPFHRDGWVYEEKFDGWRMLAIKAVGDLRALRANGVWFEGAPRVRAATLIG